MKALICIRPGLFEYKDLPVPQMKKGHALLRIRRIGICGTDLHAYQGTQPYFDYPRILGHELSADLIDADGAEGFIPGESVTFIPYFNCGICKACREGKPNCCINLKVCGVHIDGGMSEYFLVPSNSLIKNEGLDYDELALLEPFAIGAHGIRRAGVLRDEFVLVTGAGPIGLATMEFARIAGAQVIALEMKENRLAFCKNRLKIPHLIHPGKEDVLERLMKITNGEMPGVVIDASGNLGAITKAFQYTAHGGRYVLIGLQRDEIKFSHPDFHKRELTLMSSRNATRADFDHVLDAIGKGQIDPRLFITNRVKFGAVKENFDSWLDPISGPIKAMVEMEV
jgi:2-desacetyl-2-hydroxyethyl bacteriochlorophyllide A dehydrogenase